MPDERTDFNLDAALSYRMAIVSNLLSRRQFTSLQRLSDLSPHEWRVLGIVNQFQPIAVKNLAKRAALDFGQASRVASRLSSKGLVLKGSALDGRSVILTLSEPGLALYKKLWLKVIQCNHAFLNCLTNNQQQILMDALNSLEQHAVSALDDYESDQQSSDNPESVTIAPGDEFRGPI